MAKNGSKTAGTNADATEDLGPLGAPMDELRLPKLSHLVAARLRDQIVNGKLKSGSMLLPESKLLSLFNVSRPTLREALRILEAESLISVGRGMRSGALVLGPSVQKAADYANSLLVSEGVTMGDLHEARMFFEPAVVRALKGRARTDAIAHLRESIESMQSALKEQRYHDVVSGTNRFHAELARASGNRALALLVRIIQSISDDTYATILAAESTAHADLLQKNMAKTVAGYVALCDLLEKGKTDEAASFWSRYMERSLEFLKRSKMGERKLSSRSPLAPGQERAGQ